MAAMTAQEFNRYTGRAKIIAQDEPVFITDRGTIQYVLLNIEAYESLMASEPGPLAKNPFEVSEQEYFDFEVPRADERTRMVDFT